MKKLEIGLLAGLMITSVLMFYNLIMIAMEFDAYLFLADFIHYPFYLFALFTPPFMLLRWTKERTYLQFQKFILSVIPGILFLIWFFTMLRLLGDTLENF